MIALTPNELTSLLKLVEQLAMRVPHTPYCALVLPGTACDCGLEDVRREARDLYTRVAQGLIDERNHTI